MAFRITCPGCGKTVEAPDELAGKKGKCENCGTVIELPPRSVPAQTRPAEQALPDASMFPEDEAVAYSVPFTAENQQAKRAFRTTFGITLGCLAAIAVFFVIACVLLFIFAAIVKNRLDKSLQDAAASLDSGIVKSQPSDDVSQAEQNALHQLINLQQQLGGLTAENQATGQVFQFKDVTMRDDLGVVRVAGEVTNGSGQSYSTANFTITLYDKEGGLVTSGIASVRNLAKGGTKTFDVPIAGVTAKQIARYKIQFENGS